jgi:hypothetical protein
VNIRLLRWLLVALGAVLALALIIRGNVVIGAIIGTMAVVRAVLLTQLRRRARWEQHRPGRNVRFDA